MSRAPYLKRRNRASPCLLSANKRKTGGIWCGCKIRLRSLQEAESVVPRHCDLHVKWHGSSYRTDRLRKDRKPFGKDALTCGGIAMVDSKRWISLYPQNIASEIDVPDIAVPHLLDNTAKEHPDQPALSFYGKVLSYRQVDSMSRRFAAALQNSGIKKGDRIAVMIPNCPQYVVSYYGILRAGAIVTQINPMLVEQEIEHILLDSGAETIIVYDALYERIAAFRERISLKNVVIVSLSEVESDPPNTLSFSSFIRTDSQTYSPVEFTPAEDIAVLQYTGGTTGRSKGAMLTHRNLVANLVQIHEFFKNEIRPGQERYLTVIPLFHVFGMTSGMNLAILTGSLNILLPRFQLEEVLYEHPGIQEAVVVGVPDPYRGETVKAVLVRKEGTHTTAEEIVSYCRERLAAYKVPAIIEFRETLPKTSVGKILRRAIKEEHRNQVE
jgi:acyl-CoA synthetase (AMP-forming)/AMP-acid ligase II